MITNTNEVDGTQFHWTRDNTTTLTGIPASGSGSPIEGVLNSTAPGQLRTTNFTITAVADGCSSEPVIASVTVGNTDPPYINCPQPSSGSSFRRSTNEEDCFYTVQGNEFDPASYGDNCDGYTLTNSFNGSSTP